MTPPQLADLRRDGTRAREILDRMRASVPAGSLAFAALAAAADQARLAVQLAEVEQAERVPVMSEACAWEGADVV
jgi:hypothetical protein